MSEIYTVGIWTVKAGREEEFVAAWRAMGERIRELLDAFEPGTYELSAEVSANSSR